MASSMIHLAVVQEMMKEVSFRDIARLRFGVILPDGTVKGNSHLKRKMSYFHYIDSEEEWEQIQHSDYMDYVMELKNSGVIRHIGMSSHNPKVAVKAAKSDYVEMILFSINPAFDMLPASDNIDQMFAEKFDEGLKGIDADRAKLFGC